MTQIIWVFNNQQTAQQKQNINILWYTHTHSNLKMEDLTSNSGLHIPRTPHSRLQFQLSCRLSINPSSFHVWQYNFFVYRLHVDSLWSISLWDCGLVTRKQMVLGLVFKFDSVSLSQLNAFVLFLVLLFWFVLVFLGGGGGGGGGGVEAWCNSWHVCFPSLPPMLLCGFESRLGLESSGFSMWHFLKLVARGFSPPLTRLCLH